jgi:hypothetical protein
MYVNRFVVYASILLLIIPYLYISLRPNIPRNIDKNAIDGYVISKLNEAEASNLAPGALEEYVDVESYINTMRPGGMEHLWRDYPGIGNDPNAETDHKLAVSKDARVMIWQIGNRSDNPQGGQRLIVAQWENGRLFVFRKMFFDIG